METVNLVWNNKKSDVDVDNNDNKLQITTIYNAINKYK